MTTNPFWKRYGPSKTALLPRPAMISMCFASSCAPGRRAICQRAGYCAPRENSAPGLRAKQHRKHSRCAKSRLPAGTRNRGRQNLMPEIQIPIQPVENPILCSPYQEPNQHWLYDTKTGIPSKTPGRRPASYWFKTERTGSAQMSLLAEEERDDLPLVNALREDLRRWRASGWENASETTKKLLRHWWREDRGRRLFFCQAEAVETIMYLREILALGKKRSEEHTSELQSLRHLVCRLL